MIAALLTRPWLLKLGAALLIVGGTVLTIMRIHGSGRKAGEAAEKLKTQAATIAAQRKVIHVQDKMDQAGADARRDDVVDSLRRHDF